MLSKRPRGAPRRYGRSSHQALVKAARDAGAMAAKVINPSTVETADWVRWKCQFGCGGWGRSLVCPPHTPTPDQTRKMLDEVRRAVLFESPGGLTKKIAAALERKLFLAGF
jgi:predicted metal-binding protein